jgi:hypothetical protein
MEDPNPRINIVGGLFVYSGCVHSSSGSNSRMAHLRSFDCNSISSAVTLQNMLGSLGIDIKTG